MAWGKTECQYFNYVPSPMGKDRMSIFQLRPVPNRPQRQYFNYVPSPTSRPESPSSDAGAETRSVLMSVLHTLNKRRGQATLESAFKAILDQIAENPDVNVASLFPPPITPSH
jgi:hypothetical protein